MTTISTTFAWSDVITVAQTTRVVSLDSSVGISLGSSLPAPDYTGLPLAAGQSTDIPAGDFRVRALTLSLGRVNYQAWSL